jgi:hypothetical protein
LLPRSQVPLLEHGAKIGGGRELAFSGIWGCSQQAVQE